MTDRAATNPSGGVRNLLARFEAKSENTPPPSRGRSPVSSERGRSTSSRPLSKVRTSFVAVERSGQMGPVLGVRKLSEGEMAPMGNGNGEVKDTTTRTEDSHKESLKANGTTDPEATHSTAPLPDVAEEDTVNGVKENTPTSNKSKGAEASSVSSMAPKDGSEEADSANASEASPLARKSVVADTVGVAGVGEVNAQEEKDVGSILKGSPFVEDGSQPKVNGSPKKEAASKKSHAKVDSPKKPGAKEKTGQTTKASPSVKPSSNSNTANSRPLPISTKKESPASSKAPLSAKSGESKSSPKVSSAPKTPSTSISHDSTAKITSPRQPVPKSSPKTASKDHATASTNAATEGTKQRSSRVPSTNGTASSAAKSSATTSDPTKKLTSNSSKPQPKSPTRPVRLPAAATSSTAASAAKLGGPPSRSPSRAGTTAAARKAPITKRDVPAIKSRPAASTASATTQVRKKVSRPSLPPQTQEHPKSRTSITPDESFLARMMRPTAASASKVHEKIETKSPPRKTSGNGPAVTHSATSHAVKPMRRSEAMGHIKEEGKNAKNEEKAQNGSASPNEPEATQTVEPQAAESKEPITTKSSEPLMESHAGNGEAQSEEVPETNVVEANEPSTTPSAEPNAIPTVSA